MEESGQIINKPKEWVTRLREGWKEIVAEMKKTTWPNTNEVVSTTVVVLVSTMIFAFYLWGCDVVFYQAINLLFSRFGASVSS